MMITKQEKQAIIKNAAISEHDTGSCQVQMALIDRRIAQISEHLKTFPKDKHSHRGLTLLLGRRRAFAKYLARKAR
jgi:small subunit ribosomal protein S15